MTHEQIEGYRLSPQQRRLWLLTDRPARHSAQCALLLEGALRPDLLAEHLRSLVARHEILRTAFRLLPGMELPLQVILEDPACTLRQLDASQLDRARQQQFVDEQLRLERGREFDPEGGEVLQACLLKLAAAQHLLVLSLPPLCADARTLQNLVRELSELASGAPESSEDVVQYVQFCEWQHELLESEEAAEGRQFWQRRDEESEGVAPPVLPLEKSGEAALDETARGEGEPAGGDWGAVQVEVGVEELRQLEAEAARAGSRLEVLLLAGWQSLLWRLTGKPEVLAEVALDGRKYEDLYQSLGLFTKYVHVKTLFQKNSSLGDIIHQLEESYGQASEWQEYHSPADPDRRAGRAGRIGYEYVPWADPPPLQHLTFTCAELHIHTEPLKLKLTAVNRGDRLRLEFHYDPATYERAAVERLGQQYLTLLRGAVAAPEQPASHLPLLDSRERHRLLVEFNDTGREYPRGRTVHSLFSEQAGRTPEAEAVSYEGEGLTYRELDERSNRLARYLRGLGVGPETVVGLCLGRSAGSVVGVLGVLKAGGAYLPLEPSYPARRLAWVLADAGAALVLTDGESAGRLREADAGRARVVDLDEVSGEVGRLDAGPVAEAAAADNLAYVIYTSGSTGRPKGVAVAHSSVANLWRALGEAVYSGRGPGLRVSLNAPLVFDASVKQWVQLLGGHALEVVPEEVRRDPGGLARWASAARLDVLDTTPGQLRQMLGAGRLPAVLLVGGEAVDAGLWAGLRGGSGSEAFNLYGPTEATVDAAACRVRGRGAPGLGRPLCNVRAYVLDGAMEPAPAGVAGELYLGGEGLARGYLNRPALTAERFVPDPFGPAGSRLYRTGDVCRWGGDGELEYIGRLDAQVKVRGFRVEPGEVEAALLGHGRVREAAVVARGGEAGATRLVAYVVPEAGLELATAGLRSHLSELLPEYMVPSAFVTLDRLPLTPNGKVDRAALPDPEGLAGERTDRLVAPRTPTEELLAGVWCEVLGVSRVSVEDNFFELGGHSLLATRLVSRVRELFKVELPLRALFEHPTVEGLARAVEALRDEGGEGPLPPVEPSGREGRLPLSYAQQRLWFMDQLEGGSAIYNSPGVMRLSGPLDADALGRALAEVMRRHEVLRTRFGSEGGEPYQVVEEAGVKLEVVDLSGLGESEREAEAARLAYEEARRPFDLSRGPLLRAGLLRLGPEEHRLLLTMHHIACDAWSLGVLVREAAALYEAFASGQPSPLPELPVQYADYAVWQRRHLGGDKLEAQLAYWRRQLTGAPPALELPGARPRPAAQHYRGAHASFRVSSEVTEGLRAVGRSEGATLFMVMLAGFKALLSHYTGERDMVVGTDVANRTRGETEGLIGFFVNQLVLRTDLAGDPTFTELVGRVREVCLGAYANQDVPFERVVEELAPERTLSHTPLFQVKLLLQNAPAEPVEVPGLRMEALRSDSGAARFDLTVAAYESGGGLAVSMQYNAELYGPEVMERLSSHYCALLEGAARDPSLPLTRLPVMGESERRRLLVEWNDTGREYQRGRAAHELFAEQARQTPEAVAVACGEERLTYRELDERSNQLARYLRGLGVGPEVLVGLCLGRSAGLLEAALGVLKAGGAYLPLDPSYPAQHLGWMLADSHAGLVLTDSAAAGRLPAHWGVVINLDEIRDEVGALDPGPVEGQTGEDNLAYVIYTSGSTGRSKGVMVSHGGLTNYLSWCAPLYAPDGGRGTLWHTSFSFDLCVTSVYAPLLRGQTVEILPAQSDAEALVNTLRERAGYSFMKLTPAHLSLLASQLKAEEVKGLSRALVVGGENLLAETVGFWRRNAPGTRIFNEYGPTETVVGSCIYEVGEDDGHEGSIPIGRPIANTRAYVLDPRMQTVPVGVTGELYLGGDGLARGYLGRPALTAERFVPDPFGPAGSRLYRTGDVCRWGEGGKLEFMGRVDEQVKVRGFRVEPGEVEAALCRHPAVRQAVVVARGGVGPQSGLVAYCATGEAEPAEAAAGGSLVKELRAHLAERLPPYMVPSAFVMLERLPLTPNGKVDRAALPEPEQSTGGGYVAPRTPAEELLAGIWGEVLGIERVSVEDNFFELGGHSLLATMLVSRVRELFDVELPLRALFDHPTVAEIAAILEERIIEEVEQLSDEEVAARLSGADETALRPEPEKAAGRP